jgi:hypothetical protein
MVRGDCVLADHRVYRGSLVVTGSLAIGACTTVIGDVKARGALTLGAGAVVQGAVVCEQRIDMRPGSRARGPVVCEGEVLLGAGTVVGLPDAPTTLSGRDILAQEGAAVHGMLWAHASGVVRRA